jgi:signal transduction histidine kinase
MTDMSEVAMDEPGLPRPNSRPEAPDHPGVSVERLLPFLDATIEAMVEAVIVLDQPGTVIAVNQSAINLLGLPNKPAALHPLAEYAQLIRDWRVAGEPFAPDELRRSLAGETIPRQLATITTAAGIERIIQFTATPIRDDQGQVLLAMLVASDVTHEQRVTGYWKAVATAAKGLTTELEVERVLEAVLDQVVDALGGEVVIGYWRTDEVAQQLILVSYRGFSDKTVLDFRVLDRACASLVCKAVQTKQVQYTEDTQKAPLLDELDQRLAQNEDVLSLVTAPLVVTDRVRGAMAYGWRSPHRLYPEDLQAIRTISDLFAVALDHARLYEESQRRRQELEREQTMREEFIAAVAHDLREPLTVIAGNSQLLRRDGRLSGERQEKTLNAIREQAGRLERMITDLLDVSRMVARRFTIQRKPTDLVQIARGTTEEVQSRAPTHRLRLEAPEQAVGNWDEGRLRQVLENLIGNAVKFSPAGSEVVVWVIPRPYDVLVTVTDAGVGMTGDEMVQLFQPFTRVGAVQRIGGTGLGLYICRSIVETHGGRIWAESSGPGKGSTFYFTLPFV